ncbi:aspartic peptidase domain-containing protein [Cristinia sonorae]|uniref:Aspartic peptidase domain-containing protein n=1 Tax=Cristinia sonorae TaxID=1940300 RepID=A0A8K0XVK6_9AGAR|nr:aspartic peptidase domain-containing protein [Cristinia sonorae]
MTRISSSFFTLSLALFSQAFKLPASLQLARRDLDILDDGVLFSGPNQDDLFVAITVGESVVPVQLDIESSDLWVAGSLNSSDFTSSRTLPSGAIGSACIGFAGTNVTQQFYHSDNAPQGWPSSPQSFNAYGRLGLGSTANSQITKDADDGSRSFIDQLILGNGSALFITLLVSTLETDKGNALVPNGFLTVGTTVDLSNVFGVSLDRLSAVGVPIMSRVTSQPKIQIGSGGTFVVDDIRISGKSIGLESSVGGAPSGKPVAKLSTTSPWIVAPKSIVDTLYAGVPGASYSASERLYHLPCSAEISVTIVIAGVSYPLSSLDVIGTKVGSDTCVGMFQAAEGSSQGYDLLMGLPFLRNAYTLYGYGNADGKTLREPYYQFLPISTPSDSHALFIQARSPAPTPAPNPQAVTHTVFTTTTHTPTTTIWVCWNMVVLRSPHTD